jgi:hypothetical protein
MTRRDLRPALAVARLIGLTSAFLLANAANADIISVTSSVPVTISAPAAGTTITRNFLNDNNLGIAIAFNEQQNVLLGAALTTDTGNISAGTMVSSQYIAFNSLTLTSQTTTLTFDGLVLGIEFTRTGLNQSDFLGLGTLDYQDACLFCGLETSRNDSISFSGNQVFIDGRYAMPGDFIRVITASAQEIAEPGSLGLLTAALFGLGAYRLRALRRTERVGRFGRRWKKAMV